MFCHLCFHSIVNGFNTGSPKSDWNQLGAADFTIPTQPGRRRRQLLASHAQLNMLRDSSGIGRSLLQQTGQEDFETAMTNLAQLLSSTTDQVGAFTDAITTVTNEVREAGSHPAVAVPTPQVELPLIFAALKVNMPSLVEIKVIMPG